MDTKNTKKVAKSRVLPVHAASILASDEMSGMETGLLINLDSKFLQEGIKRYVF